MLADFLAQDVLRAKLRYKFSSSYKVEKYNNIIDK